MSIFRSGNSSFGHALLRFQKSSQHLICPLFFLTGTMFDNHFECSMGLMKPAARGFCTSTSGWKVRMGCITGFTPGSTLKACATKLGSNPSISSHSQAKTSAYSFRSAMSWFFSSYDKFALIEVIRGILGSLLRSTTSSFTSAGKVRVGVGGNSSHGSAMLSKECSSGVAVSTMLLRECSAAAAVS